jgi:hypothetical protein
VLIGVGLSVPVALLLRPTNLDAMGLTLMPAAVLMSALVDPRDRTAAGRIARGVIWGFGTAFMAVMLQLIAVGVGVAVGIVPNTSESPIGYVFFVLIVAVSLVPLLTVPMSGLGIGWVLLTGGIERRQPVRTEP